MCSRGFEIGDLRNWLLKWKDLMGVGDVMFPSELDPHREVRGVSTDSRHVGDGELFVALRGERFDGNDFVLEALEKGAVGAIVDTQRLESLQAQLDNLQLPHDPFLIGVPDTLRAMGAIARGYRLSKLMDLKVLAVTGSVGKTSTKQWLKTVASWVLGDGVLASQKSFNNEIGVPLTVLSARPGLRFLVLEFGARKFGDISYLARIAEPNYGLITHVAPVHLEFFRDLKGVAKVKGELIEHVLNSSLGERVFLTREVRRFYRKELESDRVELLSPKLRFSLKPDLRGTFVRLIETPPRGARQTLTFRYEGLIAKHQLMSLSYALEVIEEVWGLRPDFFELPQLISSFELPEMRTHLHEMGDGVFVLNDAYNSNPVALRASLELILDLPAAYRVGIIGDMLELGRKSAYYHRLIVKQLKALEEVLLYGSEVKHTFDELKGEMGNRVRYYPLDAFESLRTDLRTTLDKLREVKGDKVFLLKASRALALERLMDVFEETLKLHSKA